MSSSEECRFETKDGNNSLLFPSTLFPSFFWIFRCSQEVWCWGPPWGLVQFRGLVSDASFVRRMASWDGRSDLGIGFQRRGLAYFDISKWLMVHPNANRWFGFQSRMTDISQRRRLYSSSVRAPRAVVVIIPAALEIWDSEALPGVFDTR